LLGFGRFLAGAAREKSTNCVSPPVFDLFFGSLLGLLGS
jgi:hypothetical protein